MKNLGLPYLLSAGVATALLAGCQGRDEAQPPIAPVTAGGQRATHLVYGKTWMDPQAKSEELLYVADPGDDVIRVFSLVRHKLVGELSEFYEPEGACVDARGSVFFPEFNRGEVVKFPHGRKLPRVLLKGTAVRAFSCSIDPTTGNLAVTNFVGSGDSQGSVMVYPHGQGTPATYTDANIYEYYFCGYDADGNLFVDGIGPSVSGGFQFAELPKGGTSFTDITLDHTINWPGQVQWDGQYIAIGDGSSTDISRFAISGSSGTLEGTTALESSSTMEDFWIYGSNVVVADEFNVSSHGYTEAQYYRYPAGGSAFKRAGRKELTMVGVTVSRVPR